MSHDAALPEKSTSAKFHFTYVSARPDRWGLDGIPFGGVYGATLALLCAVAASRGGSVEFEHLLVLAVPVALHALLFLATHWSVEVRCWARFREERDIGKASHIKVTPLIGAARGKKVLLVPIQRQEDEVAIVYQKKKYIYNSETKTFERLKYDLASPLAHYATSQGLTEALVRGLTKKYGANAYDIPLPTFGELFQEHAVAPFFVFQVFCVVLWLMDEYWYYALLTLVMLIFAEAQMVQRRLHDLSELRAMRIPARQVHVFRDGSWRVIQSDQLLPGDIMAIMRQVDVPFPCDVLLLQGSVLANESMLTGESVPQMKVPLEMLQETPEIDIAFDIKGLHKQHIVNAGTTILLHQNNSKAKPYKKVPHASDSMAAVGYVLRIGFDTTQGKLCRTILFSAERVTVSSREALYFLMILLAFALMACAYILHDGLVAAPARDDPPRSTFKLVLAVSHIITSVVPSEFPIMLSLAVNLSLVALIRKAIFCTEPFRLPLAGKVDTCCFDKTGTLTSDSMEVAGVFGLQEQPTSSLSSAADVTIRTSNGTSKNSRKVDDDPSSMALLRQPLPFFTAATMGACSSLTVVDGQVVGDPLERAALQAVGWMLVKQDLVCSKTGKGADRVQVLQRYPFVSELQRMTVITRHQGPGHAFLPPGHGTSSSSTSNAATKQECDRTLVLTKGSCEVMRPRLREVPAEFDSLLQSLTKSGLRVLCLGAKEVPNCKGGDLEHLQREELETSLEFCGLLALRNSIKPQVGSTVRQLRRSYHRVLMITGDHPMTACQVAFNISMADRPFMSLDKTSREDGSGSSTPELVWRSMDSPENTPIPFVASEVLGLSQQCSLCVPGKSVELLSVEDLAALAPFVTVFARVSPQQKEEVVVALNRTSHTVMVGDGTNDVGALKHAHVGISLLSVTTLSPLPPPGSSSATRKEKGSSKGAPPVSQADLMAADGQAPLVRLGDASIASPFTHKGDSIKCSIHVLRCGRATQSTVLMMHKVMGLNSIISAFAMSVLTLDGVKFGDTQASIESVFTSVLFFMVSRSLPASQLSKILPSSSVFAWAVLLSLVMQLVVHMSALLYGWQLANTYRPRDYKRDLDGEFEPNLTNTVVFLLMATSHASSFFSNYEGHPFMKPISTNKALFYSLLGFIAVLVTLATEVMPDLNAFFSLVPMPDDDFRQKITILVVGDLTLTIGLSKVISLVALHVKSSAVERRARALGLGIKGPDTSSRDAEE